MSTWKERQAEKASQTALVPENKAAEPSPAAPVVDHLPEADAEFIPMCVPHQKLAVPALPGYHLHWFMGAADRIAQAQRAGYEFVKDDELMLTNRDLAGDGEPIGTDDMGTNVTRVAGGLYEGTNTAQRLYLMKIPDWLWDKHQAALAKINHAIAAELRGEGIKPTGQDNSHRYRQPVEIGRSLFDPKN